MPDWLSYQISRINRRTVPDSLSLPFILTDHKLYASQIIYSPCRHQADVYHVRSLLTLQHIQNQCCHQKSLTHHDASWKLTKSAAGLPSLETGGPGWRSHCCDAYKRSGRQFHEPPSRTDLQPAWGARCIWWRALGEKIPATGLQDASTASLVGHTA